MIVSIVWFALVLQINLGKWEAQEHLPLAANRTGRDSPAGMGRTEMHARNTSPGPGRSRCGVALARVRQGSGDTQHEKWFWCGYSVVLGWYLVAQDHRHWCVRGMLGRVDQGFRSHSVHRRLEGQRKEGPAVVQGI